jgi:predicted TIM-barrel fold metal-dependent hydrolase
LEHEPSIESLLRAAWEFRYPIVVLAAVALAALATWLGMQRRWRAVIALAALAVVVAAAYGIFKFRQAYPNQALFDGERLAESASILLGTDIPLSKFEPKPLLVVSREPVSRAKFPVIDVHFHLDSLPPTIAAQRLVEAMDATGFSQVANLDGLPGRFEYLGGEFAARYPDRFVQFVRPDFSAAFRSDDGIQRQVEWLDAAARSGARGLKVQKSLGMSVKDASGRLVAIDDPRLDPIWRKAGELGMPVLMHTSDPDAFFHEPDARNERYEEMLEHPDWVRFGKDVPSKPDLLAQRDRVIARHPGIAFIGAHFGSQEDDLAGLAERLERYPNFFVDTASVVHALGRQPYTARDFFIRYQDRIVFGSDGGYALESEGSGWTPERFFRSYIEFLETRNEYIEYPLTGPNKQGRWRVYGIDLPDDVLEKVYRLNAERLLRGPGPAPVDKQVARQ